MQRGLIQPEQFFGLLQFGKRAVARLKRMNFAAGFYQPVEQRGEIAYIRAEIQNHITRPHDAGNHQCLQRFVGAFKKKQFGQPVAGMHHERGAVFQGVAEGSFRPEFRVHPQARFFDKVTDVFSSHRREHSIEHLDGNF